MKTLIFRIVFLSVVSVIFMSCITTKKEISRNLLPVVFSDLGSNDFTIVKGLTAEVNLTGTIKGERKTYNVGKNDKTFNLNSYVYSNLFEFEHNIYYENSVDLALNYQPNYVKKFKLLKKYIPTIKIIPHHHVLTSLVEKYPDIDYFTNIRLEKETIVKSGLFNKKFDEKIKVIADGIELKTDE